MLTAPFGTWTSPLLATDVAGGSLRLAVVGMDGGHVYWLEGRASEDGRTVIVGRRPDGTLFDVTPRDSNVRTRVHEYGGGACLVHRGVAYYSEFRDQRLYRVEPGGSPAPLTPIGAWRYADADLHPSGRWLVCVREDHSNTDREAVSTIVRVVLDGTQSPGDAIVAGEDFYASPRFSPGGGRLCWVSWRHPRMPWDGTELWVADVDGAGDLQNARSVAGGPNESIHQPGWSPDGVLHFVSDRTGWWNLYRAGDDGVAPVCPMEAEVGGPSWQFGGRAWVFVDPTRILIASGRAGTKQLSVVDAASGRITPVSLDLEAGSVLAASSTHAVFVGGSSCEPSAVVRLDLSSFAMETLCSASPGVLDAAYVSKAEPIEFPTDGGLTAHAFYYAPTNPDFAAPDGERPPLVVVSHGGPTGNATTSLSLEVQYWTTRGFALVDVDYGGSSGYGRPYRQRLNGAWGLVDVADCVGAARFLVAEGLADDRRLIIRGRSAGGYTTLAALAFAPEVFSAAASHYGVSDLEALARDTHKFESRYLDTLVGPWPEARDVYAARSPIHATDRLNCPLILLQGMEDAVVPQNQAEMMADAVRDKGLPVALLLFPGEQHGFRKRGTIIRALEAELSFYGAVLGFTPAGDLAPLSIDNLASWRRLRG